MDVSIRGIDPQYVKEIDKKVNKIQERTGKKKFSRNDYFLAIIRQDSEIDLIDYKKSEFDLVVEKLLLSNEQMVESISELTSVYERLFNFLISERSDLNK
jgi:hypothetical protein